MMCIGTSLNKAPNFDSNISTSSAPISSTMKSSLAKAPPIPRGGAKARAKKAARTEAAVAEITDLEDEVPEVSDLVVVTTSESETAGIATSPGGDSTTVRRVDGAVSAKALSNRKGSASARHVATPVVAESGRPNVSPASPASASNDVSESIIGVLTSTPLRQERHIAINAVRKGEEWCAPIVSPPRTPRNPAATRDTTVQLVPRSVRTAVDEAATIPSSVGYLLHVDLGSTVPSSTGGPWSTPPPVKDNGDLHLSLHSHPPLASPVPPPYITSIHSASQSTGLQQQEKSAYKLSDTALHLHRTPSISSRQSGNASSSRLSAITKSSRGTTQSARERQLEAELLASRAMLQQVVGIAAFLTPRQQPQDAQASPTARSTSEPSVHRHVHSSAQRGAAAPSEPSSSGSSTAANSSIWLFSAPSSPS